MDGNKLAEGVEKGCLDDWRERESPVTSEELEMLVADNGKQARYLLSKDRDLIDEWAEKRSHEDFRAIMWAMMEKYQCRLGKKGPIPEETGKMLDYMARWNEYEHQWAGEE